MGKIFFVSLGCARNLVDSEFALGRLFKSGYEIVEEPQDADIGIVNTCGFIKDAKEESIDVILDLIELKKKGKLKNIIVGGCLTQRYAEKFLEELPEVDAILGINWDEIDIVLRELKSSNRLIRIKEPHYLLSYQQRGNIRLTPRHYAYLKISEGCPNRCSYCIIPKIKGPLRSRPVEEIIQEANDLISKGVREINLVAQDSTSYGIDLYGFSKISDLLKRIHSIKGDFWIRLLYTHPKRVSDELIRCYKTLPKLCKYIDVPLQHINDKILRAMKRGIDKKNIYSLIKKLRREIPSIILRTTFIVGFPGEGVKEFEELLEFMKEIEFERLGCFIYSREEGTEVYNAESQVQFRERKKRLETVMEIQKEIARKVNRRFLGEKLEVLIDEEEKGYYLARTEYDAPEVDGVVYLPKREGVGIGEFVTVRIKDALEYDLIAEYA